MHSKKCTRRSERANPAANIALVVATVMLLLATIEVGFRLLRSGPAALLHWPNFARERMSTTEDGGGSCAAAYHGTLGWTSPANCASPRFNVDADGFRRAPSSPLVAVPPILATGSSFALGEEVGDDESWPAYLQKLSGRRVVNAGVSGYSLDQTVLRTEMVTPQVKPLLVIVSFTPGDIRRTEVSVAWSRAKPHFAVVDGQLVLRNVPVPGRPNAPVPLPLPARLLGWSAFADDVVKRLGLYRGWFYDEVQAVPSGTGETIACLLMPRLAGLEAPVLVAAQYGRTYWGSDEAQQSAYSAAVQKVLDCAGQWGLMTFDPAGPLKRAIEARGIDSLYKADHQSAEGNRTIAELIMDELVRRRFFPPPAGRQD